MLYRLVGLERYILSSRQYVYALLAVCTLGILMPFWCYNVFGNANRGHKLFMGDAGSLYAGLRDQLPDHSHERDERGPSDIVQPVHGDRFLRYWFRCWT